LTVEGQRYTQPLQLHLDPRVKTPQVGLTQLSTLTKEMYDGARKLHAAAEQARALSTALEQGGPDAAALKEEVTALAPPPPAGGRGGFGAFGGGRGRGGPAGPPTLDSASNAMMAAAMGMQGADVAPTARDVQACADARRQSTAVMAKWNRITTVDLPALNAKRKAAGQEPIVVKK